MGGSSKKVTVGYKYYLGMHMILCHGPVDFLRRIYVDSKRTATGFFDDEQISINAPNLFGGEKREGGIVGNVDFENGQPTQGRNGYLQARLGSNIPAFRGVCAVVLRQVYLGVNPYLKRWAFRLQRVYRRQDGIEQWYPSTAGLIHDDSADLIFNETFAGGLSGYTFGGTLDDFDIVGGALQITGTTGGGISRINKTFSEADWSILQLEFNPVSVGTSTGGNTEDIGVFHIEDASGNIILNFTPIRDEGADPLRRSHLTFLSGQTGLYMSDEMLELNRWYKLELVLNRSTNAMYGTLSVRDTGEVIKSATGLSLFSYAKAAQVEFRNETGHGDGGVSLWDNVQIYAGEQVDMNPAHIIRECLTDPDWGMGYQDSDIDDVSFTVAADTLFLEKMGISLLWDRQNTIEAFVQEIVKHIDAALYVDRTTGKFVLKLIRDDYDEGSLIELDESNISQIQNLKRASFGELINSVTVNYWDYKTGETASLTVQDTALAQMQNASINTTVQYPGFTNGSIAGRAAARDLRALSIPLWSCTVYADKTAEALNIGDTFKLSWSDYGLDSVIMRVVGMSFGNGTSNRVKLICTQDVFALPNEAVVVAPDPGDGWTPIDNTAQPLTVRLLNEAPYYELVTLLGQVAIDDDLTANPDLGYLMAAAGRPSAEGAINALTYVDPGSGVYEDSDTLDFSPFAYLAEDIDENTLTFAIENGEDIDVVEVGQHCEIEGELCRVDAISTSSVTLGRAILDTSPKKHLTGAPIVFWDVYPSSDEVEYVASDVVNVKLLTVTGESVLDESAAPVDSLTFASRAIRPYPPGNFQIDGLSYPTDHFIDGTATLTWAHRDRLQQTSGDFFDHSEPNIGPEAGTTYKIESDAILDDDSVVSNWLSTNVGNVTTWEFDPSTNVPPTNSVKVRFRVISARDGYESWQSPEAELGLFAAPDGLSATYAPFVAPDNLQAINI